jgi:hypothetical protein
VISSSPAGEEAGGVRSNEPDVTLASKPEGSAEPPAKPVLAPGRIRDSRHASIFKYLETTARINILTGCHNAVLIYV